MKIYLSKEYTQYIDMIKDLFPGIEICSVNIADISIVKSTEQSRYNNKYIVVNENINDIVNFLRLMAPKYLQEFID